METSEVNYFYEEFNSNIDRMCLRRLGRGPRVFRARGGPYGATRGGGPMMTGPMGPMGPAMAPPMGGT